MKRQLASFMERGDETRRNISNILHVSLEVLIASLTTLLSLSWNSIFDCVYNFKTLSLYVSLSRIIYFFSLSDKDCRPIMDIAFIIDSSGSIGSSNWERMKRFLKALVSKLDVSASATHVAAVAYSTNPQVVMTFRNFQGTSQVNQVLDFMRWQRGLTYTDKALQLADRELFQTAKGMRSSVPKVGRVR